MPTTDCAETRALLALLAGMEVRANIELRHLSPRAREALAVAARRLAELCEEPGAADPTESWMGPS